MSARVLAAVAASAAAIIYSTAHNNRGWAYLSARSNKLKQGSLVDISGNCKRCDAQNQIFECPLLWIGDAEYSRFASTSPRDEQDVEMYAEYHTAL
jgi:hypothetical protein